LRNSLSALNSSRQAVVRRPIVHQDQFIAVQLLLFNALKELRKKFLTVGKIQRRVHLSAVPSAAAHLTPLVNQDRRFMSQTPAASSMAGGLW
jgi:hypothetical protein